MAVRIIPNNKPSPQDWTSNPSGPLLSEEKEVRQQPTRKLPTDRIAFARQLDILRAYAIASQGGTKPVHYSTAAEVVKMSATTVPLMNTFILDNSFVEKSGNDFIPCRALLEFAQAYTWNADTAPLKLAPMIRATWFGERMLTKLAFGGMTSDDMVADLAAQVSAPPDCKSQIETLIEYAVVSGLVKRDGNQLSLGTRAAPEAARSEPMEKTIPPTDVQEPKADNPRAASAVATGFSSASGRVRFHVDIDADMTEIGTWPPERITAFFAGLAQVLAAKKGTETV